MTATTSAAVGTAAYRGGALREDLANFISNISRDERPFLSSIGSTSATLPRHEWQTDTLADPAFDAQSEAFVFNTDNNANITTQRLSNYTQIFGKTVDISGSLLESDPAGASNWFAYSMKKRGRELMRDIEQQAMRYSRSDHTPTGIGRVVYGTTNPRHLGSVYAYAANWLTPATGTVGVYNSAGTATAITTTPGTAYNYNDAGVFANGTDGKTSYRASNIIGSHAAQYTTAPAANVALTVDMFSEILRKMYESGGRPNAVQVPSALKAGVSKTLINGNGGAAQRRADTMSNKVNIAVDSIMTDFGFDLAIIPNYIMQGAGSGASVLIYDTDMVKKAVLKGMTVREDQQARYGKAAIMFEECTLEVKNQNAIGVISGITNPSA